MIKKPKKNNLNPSIYYLILINSLCLLMSHHAKADSQAEQYFSINNNGTVLARSSLREITRIVFTSEIISVNAISGELEYAVAGKELYLRTALEKPINFFISLEGGWTFKVVLSAEDIPATQIFVKGKTSSSYSKALSSNKQNSEISQNVSPFLKGRIEKIIAVALNPKKHIGYEIIARFQKLRESTNKLEMNLIGIISGDMLKAEKISITNKSKEKQTLWLNDFMAKDFLGVYLTKTLLLPEEKSILIRISEN